MNKCHFLSLRLGRTSLVFFPPFVAHKQTHACTRLLPLSFGVTVKRVGTRPDCGASRCFFVSINPCHCAPFFPSHLPPESSIPGLSPSAFVFTVCHIFFSSNRLLFSSQAFDASFPHPSTHVEVSPEQTLSQTRPAQFALPHLFIRQHHLILTLPPSLSLSPIALMSKDKSKTASLNG